MRSSENINELATALAKAQGDFAVAVKDKKGVHDSTYADLNAVYDATREPLSKNGLSVVQFPTYDGEFVCLTTRLMHSSGQWLEDDLKMKPDSPKVHPIGSCITYSRRYAFCAIVGVVADEDDDGNAANGVSNHGQQDKGKKVFLNVPFEEKEEAKKWGAKWDQQAKQWFVYEDNTDAIKRWGLPKTSSVDVDEFINF